MNVSIIIGQGFVLQYKGYDNDNMNPLSRNEQT